ncbi:MAG: S8 family peptidase [Candidatus Zixiibacteriota bacterium]
MMTLRIPILILAVIILPAALEADSGWGTKLTPRAASVVNQTLPNEVANCWLLLDSSVGDRTSVPLTDRARARRDRVDPVNHLVDWRDFRISEDALQFIRATGARVRTISRWLKAVSVEATPSQLASLAALNAVQRVDVVNSFRFVPDPYEPTAPKVSAPDAEITEVQNDFTKAAKLHQYGLSGKGVLIALFDTGYDIHHRAFDSTRIVATYDFINADTVVDGPDCPQDFSLSNHQDYHGTLVLGAIGGFIRDTLIGTAYRADYALAKTEITCGGVEHRIEEDNWIAAAEWADSVGADIISSSLGYNIFQDSGSYTIDQLDGNTARITVAADIAASKNILVVIAAGNERGNSWNRITFPADGDSVIAVGAATPDSQVTSFSSPGPSADGRIKPDIASLGTDVATALVGSGTTDASGTSLATPLVAGGAALALEQFPAITADELRTLIKQNGSHAGNPDNNLGYGIYDAARSADIIRIDKHDPITIRVGERVDVAITTSGRIGQVPALAVVSPFAGIVFEDNFDGTGTLQVDGVEQNIGSRAVRLTAAITGFVDTTAIIISTYPAARPGLTASPNPFSGTITIQSTTADPIKAVTIFNSAGENLWEWLNRNNESADIVQWDGRNARGQLVAPGVYLARVQTSRGNEIVKIFKTD